MRRYTLTIGGRRFTIDVEALSASSFQIALDGQSYAVTIESAEQEPRPAVTPMVEGFPARAQAPTPPTIAAVATPPVPPPAPTRSAAPAPPRPGSDDLLTAPMPGTVLTVEASLGAAVRRGDPLLTLEAMKMQNIIRAPADATVAEILVVPGQSVGFGEPLVRFAKGTP